MLRPAAVAAEDKPAPIVLQGVLRERPHTPPSTTSVPPGDTKTPALSSGGSLQLGTVPAGRGPSVDTVPSAGGETASIGESAPPSERSAATTSAESGPSSTTSEKGTKTSTETSALASSPDSTAVGPSDPVEPSPPSSPGCGPPDESPLPTVASSLGQSLQHALKRSRPSIAAQALLATAQPTTSQRAARCTNVETSANAACSL